MDPQRWLIVKEIVFEALQRPADERPSYGARRSVEWRRGQETRRAAPSRNRERGVSGPASCVLMRN